MCDKTLHWRFIIFAGSISIVWYYSCILGKSHNEHHKKS